MPFATISDDEYTRLMNFQQALQDLYAQGGVETTTGVPTPQGQAAIQALAAQYGVPAFASQAAAGGGTSFPGNYARDPRTGAYTLIPTPGELGLPPTQTGYRFDPSTFAYKANKPDEGTGFFFDFVEQNPELALALMFGATIASPFVLPAVGAAAGAEGAAGGAAAAGAGAADAAAAGASAAGTGAAGALGGGAAAPGFYATGAAGAAVPATAATAPVAGEAGGIFGTGLTGAQAAKILQAAGTVGTAAAGLGGGRGGGLSNLTPGSTSTSTTQLDPQTAALLQLIVKQQFPSRFGGWLDVLQQLVQRANASPEALEQLVSPQVQQMAQAILQAQRGAGAALGPFGGAQIPRVAGQIAARQPVMAAFGQPVQQGQQNLLGFVENTGLINPGGRITQGQTTFPADPSQIAGLVSGLTGLAGKIYEAWPSRTKTGGMSVAT